MKIEQGEIVDIEGESWIRPEDIPALVRGREFVLFVVDPGTAGSIDVHTTLDTANAAAICGEFAQAARAKVGS